MKEEANEHPFSDWSPDLTMGSSMKHMSWEQQQNHDHHHHYTCEMPNIERDRDRDDHLQHQHQAKKVMHHFLDEWPPKKHKDSIEDNFNTHLSISSSLPNSLHDFFIKEKW